MTMLTNAQKVDAEGLAALVFAAAPTLLTELLAADSSTSVIDFLQVSLQQPEGQYGYANHYVFKDGDVPIASFCLWHDQLPSDFDQATLRMMHKHFGLERCLEIVRRNQSLSEHLRPPETHQVAIGHISVAKAHRRRGFVGEMLSFARQQAISMAKTALVVDVERDNHIAIQCYLKYGFTQGSESPQRHFTRMTLGV